MLTPSPQSPADDGAGYGMGIGRVEYDGITCYGHGGYWGTLVRHCPELDLTVVAAVTSASATAELGALMAEAIAIIAAAVADPTPADGGTEIR